MRRATQHRWWWGWGAVLLLAAAPPAWADRSGLTTALALGDAFADVAEQVGPATVYIQADKGRPISLGLQELMQEYDLPALGGGRPGWSSSTGSGVLVRADGLVLTNHHVISGAQSLTVTLWDKRTYPAHVVGSDPRTDIAVLQIEGEGPFPTAPVGDSDAVRIGHWVIAVGHPFDFQFTVTAGIVSARGRRNIIREEIQDYIQTDAAVNPGSSGGPLFNLRGEIVGINTAIYTPEGGSVQHAGISFAIPSNMAWRIARELMETGHVARASIGVSTRDAPATPDHPRPGAEITHVFAAGPAERAGLRRGDIILQVDQEAIGSGEDLRGLVRARGPGVTLSLTVERGGELRVVTLTPVVPEQIGALLESEALPTGTIEWAGLTLADASEANLSRFGVVLPPSQKGGALVLAVRPDSPGDDAGIAPGDVLLYVQKDEIGEVAQVLSLVGERRSVVVRFWRDNAERVAALGGLND